MSEDFKMLLLGHLKQIEVTLERIERTLDEFAQRQIDTVGVLRDGLGKP